MTPRERVLAILKKGKPDKVPWFGDLDYWATALIGRREKPKDFKESDAYIDWHRELGVGFYLQGYFPFTEIIENCNVKNWNEGNLRYREIETPKGKLRECWKWLTESFSEAPVEHLVKSEKNLEAYKYVFENTRYEPDYRFAQKKLNQVGEMGVVLCYTPRTPFMQMIAVDAGVEAVTYMVLSAPDEFAETIRVMGRTLEKAYQIAIDSPAEVLMMPENLSAEMVGPRFFEQFIRKYQEEWSQKIINSGKYSCIHMDGTLRALLREECSVGLSFIEALTPKPVGDLAIEEWADYAGDSKTILWGGIPGVYFTSLINDEEFDRHIKEVLSVMRKKPGYVLGVADQVPPDGLEQRVKRVGELVDDFGAYE